MLLGELEIMKIRWLFADLRDLKMLSEIQYQSQIHEIRNILNQLRLKRKK